MNSQFRRAMRCTSLVTALVLSAVNSQAQAPADEVYEHEETRALVALVTDAAVLVETRGDAAFGELRQAGSRWQQGESYIFVLDPDGQMVLHPDPALEGRNQLDLKDINGRPIIRGLIDAANVAGKPAGWYHYQWPVPGAILPRWKSSYVRLVAAPSGQRYIVGSGVYNDRMERAFVQDAVTHAVRVIETEGAAAYARLHDPAGPFMAKDAYVFVIDSHGTELVNAAFPNLEGRNLLDVTDTAGKPLVREMMDVVRARGAGWVDYMWPKPGESASTQKSTYVSKARVGDDWVVVGCGVYLADAPREARATAKLTAPELQALVRDAAGVLEARGEAAYPEFRTKGSRWFRDDTYLFVWTLEGTRVFHAADPSGEGRSASGVTDTLGRPYGRQFLEAAASPSGEGWVHYMFPEPGDIFPTWKSTFVKRVTYPSGERYLVGSGIYHMEMDRAFIEDVVDRAAALVAARGPGAFAELRDRTGPFVFMDTYVFVMTTEGTELVNPALPGLEGQNLLDLKDLAGNPTARQEIAAAMAHGSAWVDGYWFKPGGNTPARKQTYVRKVRVGARTYIVGSGFYVDEESEHGTGGTR